MLNKAIQAAMLGRIDTEQLEAINTAVVHGELFKGEAFAVVDVDGDRLVKNQIYLHRGERVRVTDCEFGSGNILESWYHVYFINSKLEDDRITIDAKFPQGAIGPKTYTAPFTKVRSDRE